MKMIRGGVLGLFLFAQLAAAEAPKRIAVLTLETSGVPPSLAATATALIPTAVREHNPHAEVLGPDEVTGLVSVQRQRQLAGAGADGMRALAQAVAADEVVSGRIGALGNTVVIELHREDPARARVIRSGTRTVEASGSAVADAVHELVDEVYGLSLDDRAVVAQRTRGAVLGGVGVVLLAAGIVGIAHVQTDVRAYTAQQSPTRAPTLTQAQANTDRWLWPASLAAGAVGLVGVAVGAWQLFAKPPDVVPSVTVTGNGGSFSLSGTF